MSSLMIHLVVLPLTLVGFLPAQDPPAKPDPDMLALDTAFERAAARDMRVAILVSQEKVPEIKKLVSWWRRADLAGVPLRYEYEFVHYKGDAGLLRERLKTSLIEPRFPLVLCSADGSVLSQRAVVLGDLEPAQLEARLAWLAEHKVAVPDARTHLAAALALATKTDRRVLVHLGAPW